MNNIPFNVLRDNTINRYFDEDYMYGYQCWDYYAKVCTMLGVPYANCTSSGFVKDIWLNRKSNGMLNYFDEIKFDLCQPGDIIVFQPRGKTPYSHIGVVASTNQGGQVLVLGQNQGGNGAVNEAWLPLTDSYPTVFRLKQKKMTQLDGNVKPVNDLGLRYQAHTQDIGWREWIHDGMIAGSTGAGKRLEALRIDTSAFGDKLKLNVKVHIMNIGWKTVEDVQPDTIIGTVGRGLLMEAIEIDPVVNETGKKLYYQVHLANTGWTGRVEGGYATGTVGLKKAIEAIRIWLE